MKKKNVATQTITLLMGFILSGIVFSSVSLADYGTVIQGSLCGSGGNNNNNYYPALSQGNGWSNAWYPSGDGRDPADDIYAQRGEDHPVDIHISRVDVRHENEDNHHQEIDLKLAPGDSDRVKVKVKVQNRSDHNFWYVRHEVCVNNTRRFKHDERRVVDFEELDDDALDDLDPGDRESEDGFRDIKISLSEDAQSVRIKARDRNEQTFSVTEEDIERGEVHLYFWLDTYALGYANQTDRDTSSKKGDEYATVNVKLPWIKSKFVISTVAGEAPLLVDFEDKSTGSSSGVIVTRKYIFGDGASVTLANTQHVYTEPGNYDVEFKVTSSWGETKTAVIPIVVTVPIINGLVNTYFGSTDPSNPLELTEPLTEGRCFTGISTTLIGNGVIGNSWEWTCQGEDGGTNETGYAVMEEVNDVYTNLTLATGTAIGYGDGVVEGQTDSFSLNDTIHFGVFANVTVPHTWRIESYHNDSFWWEQASGSREILNHSFHSLNQTATLEGNYTFKVFLKDEFVEEKTVVVEEGGSNPDPEPEPEPEPDSTPEPDPAVNYTDLTLATGTAIGYGDGVVENQTDSFSINDTIHFGVFANVTVPHTWRIEAWHNNSFWWGQDSDSRDSSTHSFHSLNQTVTTSGTFTFKVLLDEGNGFEQVGEKSVIIE